MGDEHVIFRGIGGNLLVPAASCQRCERTTSAIESKVLNSLFGAAEKRMGIVKGKLKNKFPVTMFAGDESITVSLDIERHPTMLFLPMLASPGILVDRQKGESGIAGAWVHSFPPPEEVTKNRSARYATPSLDTVLFSQFLAKIAHSFAVGRLGMQCFRPLLAELIQMKLGKADTYHECHH